MAIKFKTKEERDKHLKALRAPQSVPASPSTNDEDEQK
jgi:hypothetical protein